MRKIMEKVYLSAIPESAAQVGMKGAECIAEPGRR
jgi:hypothetical protein